MSSERESLRQRNLGREPFLDQRCSQRIYLVLWGLGQMALMSGLMWAKRMLFEGGKKGCRRSQRRNGESAFLKIRKGVKSSERG